MSSDCHDSFSWGFLRSVSAAPMSFTMRASSPLRFGLRCRAGNVQPRNAQLRQWCRVLTYELGCVPGPRLPVAFNVTFSFWKLLVCQVVGRRDVTQVCTKDAKCFNCDTHSHKALDTALCFYCYFFSPSTFYKRACLVFFLSLIFYSQIH